MEDRTQFNSICRLSALFVFCAQTAERIDLIFGRPIGRAYRTVIPFVRPSVRSSVRYAVNCGETAEPIRIKFGTDVGTGPGTKVLKFGLLPQGKGGLAPTKILKMSGVGKRLGRFG